METRAARRRRLAVRGGFRAAGVAAAAGFLTAAGATAAQERRPREPTEATDREPSGETTVLMLWGGVRAGELVLEPAFAYEGAVRRPGEPGPYRVRGLDDQAETLFSISFVPGEISDGSKGFNYAIPFDSSWKGTLDRLELRGPEGVVTVDRQAGARGMMVIDRATGQVRSILRNSPAVLPPELAADSSRVLILRGLPRPPDRGVSFDPPGRCRSRVAMRGAPEIRPGSSVGRATDF